MNKQNYPDWFAQEIVRNRNQLSQHPIFRDAIRVIDVIAKKIGNDKIEIVRQYVFGEIILAMETLEDLIGEANIMLSQAEFDLFQKWINDYYKNYSRKGLKYIQENLVDTNL